VTTSLPPELSDLVVFTNRAESFYLSSSAPGLWTGEVGGSYSAEASWTETPLPASFKLKEVPHLLSFSVPPPMALLPCLDIALDTLLDVSRTDPAEVELLQDLEDLFSIEPGIHREQSGDLFSHDFMNFDHHLKTFIVRVAAPIQCVS